MKKILMLLAISLAFVSCGKAIPETDPNIDLNNISGKRTFIGFVGTFCPHCKEEVPVLDTFYRDYKGQVNMQLINTDGKKFVGDFIIPQDTSNPISYEQVTGDKCDYIPSFVIFDENKQITKKVCGGKITYEELQAELLVPGTASGTGENLSTNTWETMKNTYQLEWFKEGDIWVIMTTTNWKLEIKLFTSDVPKTANNFLALSKNGYYDNLTFHRVIKDFMIQWGDPEGTGMGGESIYGDAFEDEFTPKLTNIRGSLSMANSGPNTNGSQFFINQRDNNFLDNKHSVFGQVVNGLDNVDKIAGSKTNKDDKPEKEIKIIKMEVVQYQSGALKPYNFSLEEATQKSDEEKKVKAEADKNRLVKNGDKVAVHYVLTTLDDGKEFDNSYSRGAAFEFELWADPKQVVPGFEAGVIGMKIGEKKTLTLKAADAYGPKDNKNIQEVPKSDLKDFEDNGFELKVWVKLPTMYGEFEIIEVKDTTVKVDLNHPLAGKDLKFVVEMIEFKN